jgi:hypothetical protein
MIAGGYREKRRLTEGDNEPRLESLAGGGGVGSRDMEC